MAQIDTVFEKLTADPAAWSRVQKELAEASDPRARFIELAKEQGLSVDPDELAGVLEKARQELREDELEAVAGGALGLAERGFNPQPDPPDPTVTLRQDLFGLLSPAVQKVR